MIGDGYARLKDGKLLYMSQDGKQKSVIIISSPSVGSMLPEGAADVDSRLRCQMASGGVCLHLLL